jgi:hypothetical protein
VARHADGVDRIAGEVDGVSGAVATAMAELRATLRADQEAAVAAIREVAGEAEARLARSREMLERAVSRLGEQGDELETELRGVIDGLGTELRARAGDATKDLVAATTRLDEASGQLGALEAALLGYLERRDAAADEERVALVRDLVDQLADGLSRRERKKLAARLDVPDPTTVQARKADPATYRHRSTTSTGQGTRPPAPAPPARPVARTPQPAEPQPSTDEAPAVVPAKPAARSAPAARTVPVKKAPAARRKPAAGRAARPVAEPEQAPGATPEPEGTTLSASEDAPTDTRSVLAAIRGVGPAKQSALIDEFGDLEGIRAASLDELAALKGIGPTLAAAIREHLDA